MKKILIIGWLAIASIISASPARAQTSSEIVHEIVTEASQTYGVNPDEMWRTLWCESRFKFDAMGDPHLGVSIGIAQINMRWNPDVTPEQALDPVFSIHFMARKMSVGKAHLWTCWRSIYGAIAQSEIVQTENENGL